MQNKEEKVEHEHKEEEANLDAYLELAWEVFEELAVENKGKMRKPKKRVDSVYREFNSSQGSAPGS
jgi:hypothetical protein